MSTTVISWQWVIKKIHLQDIDLHSDFRNSKITLDY